MHILHRIDKLTRRAWRIPLYLTQCGAQVAETASDPWSECCHPPPAVPSGQMMMPLERTGAVELRDEEVRNVR